MTLPPDSPPKGFTDTFLKRLKTTGERYELRDFGTPILRLRVSPTGIKMFSVLYRDASGKRTRKTLGAYGQYDGQLTLAQARTKALDFVERVQAGAFDEKNDIPQTVVELCDVFYKRRILARGLKRPDVVWQILDHDIIPVIGRRQLNSVTRTTLAHVIDHVVDRGAVSHAGKVLAYLKMIFTFAESRGYIENNPARSLKRDDFGVVNKPRTRALDVDNESGVIDQEFPEILALWSALEDFDKMALSFRVGLKILLLTGVRSGELRMAEWKHIDFNKGEWLIPPGNSKTSRPTMVPLTPAVNDLFRTMKQQAEGSQWVMPSPTNDKPVEAKSLSRAMRRLRAYKDDSGMLVMDIPHFTVHDLRRTCRSHLGALGVSPRICEAVLNHSQSKIEGTYDVYSYFDERREALEKWADRVDRALYPVENVVELIA